MISLVTFHLSFPSRHLLGEIFLGKVLQVKVNLELQGLEVVQLPLIKPIRCVQTSCFSWEVGRPG